MKLHFGKNFSDTFFNYHLMYTLAGFDLKNHTSLQSTGGDYTTRLRRQGFRHSFTQTFKKIFQKQQTSNFLAFIGP
jgi:hypothetical protein